MKTADLTGAELDYWVAKAEGEDPEEVRSLQYSRSWRDGGKIMQRECISTIFSANQEPFPGWRAFAELVGPLELDTKGMQGPTPLIAAMRAYVCSVFGPDVDATA